MTYIRTLQIADLLSVYQRNRQRWRIPQNFASVVVSSIGEVKPPSSLRVELPISGGRSMGPDPWNNTTSCDLSIVAIFHLNVPTFLASPPSDAISIIRPRFQKLSISRDQARFADSLTLTVGATVGVIGCSFSGNYSGEDRQTSWYDISSSLCVRNACLNVSVDPVCFAISSCSG
jgi:hypothetical protein